MANVTISTKPLFSMGNLWNRIPQISWNILLYVVFKEFEQLLGNYMAGPAQAVGLTSVEKGGPGQRPVYGPIGPPHAPGCKKPWEVSLHTENSRYGPTYRRRFSFSTSSFRVFLFSSPSFISFLNPSTSFSPFDIQSTSVLPLRVLSFFNPSQAISNGPT